MARRPNVTIHGNTTHDDDPPPSTLAAQIVQNQTRPAESQRHEETASFRDLLHEILHNQAAAQEHDVNVNTQLVSVVNQAGLIPLTVDNPFAEWDMLIPQAKDSIAVIEFTVQRQPDVLFTELTANGPQLALSLIATSVALCGRPKCEEISASRVLIAATRTLDSSIHLWQRALTLRCVLQDCVDETLSALEALPVSSNAVSLVLPPARSVAKLWPQSENSIAMPEGSTTLVTEATRALFVVLELCKVPDLDSSWLKESYLRLQQVAGSLRIQLTKVDQWQRAFKELLLLSNNWLFVTSMLNSMPRNGFPNSQQQSLATALLKILRDGNDRASDHILPVLRKVLCSDIWSSLHEDFKLATITWLARHDSEEHLNEGAAALRESLCDADAMTDGVLRQEFRQLSTPHTCNGRRPRLRKRPKVSPLEDVESRKQAMVQRFAKLLAGDTDVDLEHVPISASSVYATLTEDDQCAVWQALTDLAEYDLQLVLRTVTRLLENDSLRPSKRARILSQLTIRACVERTIEPEVVSLGSLLGRHCLLSLQSSVRELRLAAAQTLPLFLRESLPGELKSANRHAALDYLRAASERDVANEQETLISAWGQVAVSCGQPELNLVLLRLVEYLGHSNSLICALAFTEIEAVAAFKGIPPGELFQPFWRSIAVAVVQDILVRPQKAQQLCDLLSMDMNNFLVMSQRDTLPFLVLTGKKAILQRIATARGNSCTIEDLCMQPRTNLATILALLLSQSSHEAEEFAFGCLTKVAPELSKTDLPSLIKVDAVLVAAEMLKLSGEQAEDRKSRAYQCFQTFCSIAERAPGQRKSHTKSAKAVQAFLQDKMLGILTLFSTMLENGPGAESTPEKARCLKGMADMFVLAKGNLSFALPQIRACLQSGLEQPDLCGVAFDAWLSLMPVLEDDDVALMIDETFVLIVRHWPVLSSDTQMRTRETLSQLVKAHNTLLQENIMTLPSLAGIPLLSKFAAEFERLKSQESVESHCKAFADRLRDDSDTVVLQSVVELVPFLEANQDFIHETAASEHPARVLSDLLCALLDVTVKYSNSNSEAAGLCGKALGIIGSLDPNRVEATRNKGQLLVLSNFDKASEVIEWVVSLLQDVLVKAFKSVTNAKSQGFLAYTMQELLGFCQFTSTSLRSRSSQNSEAMTKWYEMPEHVRTTLTPLLSSKYIVTSNAAVGDPNRAYPGFSSGQSHSHWIRSITYDLMFKGKGDNAKAVFILLARVIRGQDLAVARFVFPYAVLNIVIGGTELEIKNITKEFMAVLESSPETPAEQETIRLCSESVFGVLDYMSTWLREKRKELSETRTAAYKTGHSPNEFDEARDMGQIETVENFLASIPAKVIANQAMECRSYARALFHWEQYIRRERSLVPSGRLTAAHSAMYDRLQEIYTQIEEPDGLEGIAAHLPLVTEDQQAIHHAKAGRWTAAQAWYELQLAEYPGDTPLQHGLLQCLRETGQFAPLLRYANSFLGPGLNGCDSDFTATAKTHLPATVEACWMTENFDELRKKLELEPHGPKPDFNIGVGQFLLHTRATPTGPGVDQIVGLRRSIAEGLSMASTSSLQTCHDELVKLHVLYELEAMACADAVGTQQQLLRNFDRRLNAVGAYIQDKQYILGVRRAMMGLLPNKFIGVHIRPLWLTTARLARQSKNIASAYNAVLKAYDLGDPGAKVEEARLLWHEGHQRQAIQALEAAIDSGVLEGDDSGIGANVDSGVSITTASGIAEINGYKQNPLLGKALLLLAKWLDASGQSQTKDMTDRYQVAARRHQRWEKGHYYLGKHYSKLLDAQKALPREKQSQPFLTGELTKLVIDNSLRSIPFGNKYWHETIPRVLTLWLQLGMDAHIKTRQEDQATFDKRVRSLQACNRQLQKYFERVPAYVFYHALPQLISRITHPHPEVWKQLSNILTRIASTHPSQTLWSLFAVIKATDSLRRERGQEILTKLKDPKNRTKNDTSGIDLRATIIQGQRLCDGLLLACERPIEARSVACSLFKTLEFSAKLAPSNLVVPVEANLVASPPAAANSESIRRHKAFTQDRVTIQSFLDEVLVLNSLQRPRKITIRGSDGKLYGILCKPKDDLRKDQRLMEFNGIINRALKRNTESSKRRLYIKTYAVTPLSEESGSIEWVEGIKPMRDILLNLYSRRGVRPNYNDIKKTLDAASQAPEHAHLFAEEVLNQFSPVLHEWFTETYPEPEVWFNARIRYARSAAVMSMVGHILGLGDRHGENILLEESTGGVFHVDFNCLFDKGLTFEKPELVPFRLTHNMVDAMGPYGYEGPFRKSSELTLGLLRQERDTLMTVLETFLYDPTTDFVDKKKKKTSHAGVPDTPKEILESVATKLKGLLRGETVPLSVEGYVDALCQQATSHFHLASMYIGWCSFL